MTTTDQLLKIEALAAALPPAYFKPLFDQVARIFDQAEPLADHEDTLAVKRLSDAAAARLIDYLEHDVRGYRAAMEGRSCHYCGLPLDRYGRCEDCDAY